MRLLVPKEAAAQLRVSIATLRRWRKQGAGPPLVRIGRTTYRYSEEGIESYITRQTVAAMNDHSRRA